MENSYGNITEDSQTFQNKGVCANQHGTRSLFASYERM